MLEKHLRQILAVVCVHALVGKVLSECFVHLPIHSVMDGMHFGSLAIYTFSADPILTVVLMLQCCVHRRLSSSVTL